MQHAYEQPNGTKTGRDPPFCFAESSPDGAQSPNISMHSDKMSQKLNPARSAMPGKPGENITNPQRAVMFLSFYQSLTGLALQVLIQAVRLQPPGHQRE